MSPVAKAIDWEALRWEAEKVTDPATRTERLAYVEFWKRLADAHDFATRSSMMNAFEWKVCQLLDEKNDLGLPKYLACKYLLAEDLPAWAESLRLIAGGVLAGGGERRGMEVLLEAVRAVVEEPQKDPRGYGSIGAALGGTWTEKALPLWAEAARDTNAKVRLVVVRNVGAVKSEKAIPILLALLKDDDRDVRTAAAVALMERDVKEAAPVLLERPCPATTTWRRLPRSGSLVELGVGPGGQEGGVVAAGVHPRHQLQLLGAG